LRQKAEELAKKMGIENCIASGGWFHRWNLTFSIFLFYN
jgi:hypothetical protein